MIETDSPIVVPSSSYSSSNNTNSTNNTDSNSLPSTTTTTTPSATLQTTSSLLNKNLPEKGPFVKPDEIRSLPLNVTYATRQKKKK